MILKLYLLKILTPFVVFHKKLPNIKHPQSFIQDQKLLVKMLIFH